MNITVDTRGMEEAMRALSPERVYTALMLWYDRGSRYIKGELAMRAPRRLKGKVKVLMDLMRPPRWARVYVKGGLAHLIEGGTGALGAGGFSHVSRHWPSTEGIMRQTGLPRPEAFLVARSIGMRGGNPPRPFIMPTYEATKGRVEQMAVEAVNEAVRE